MIVESSALFALASSPIGAYRFPYGDWGVVAADYRPKGFIRRGARRRRAITQLESDHMSAARSRMSSEKLSLLSNGAFHMRRDPANGVIQRVEIRLRAAITEPYATTPPVNPKLFEFVIDTGADYANVFPSHLSAAGLSISGTSGGYVEVILYDGSVIKRPMRDVTLWLYGDDSVTNPIRIDLNGGVVVLPSVPDPDSQDLLSPLLGMNAIIDAGLRLEIDAYAGQFSIWAPIEHG